MFEFLIATGKFGALGICAVFVVVFVLAEAGKEISFWGIKFHKKYRFNKSFNWRRVPKKLPEEWKMVLLAFADLDENYIHEKKLFEQTKKLAGYSELKTRSICAEMEKYRLIQHLQSYVSLQEKALPLANHILSSSNNE